MSFLKTILARAFKRPRGVLGRLGGMIMARENRRMARQAIALLDIQADDRVLEVGFGPGVGIDLLANSTPAQAVAGIDPSQAMLEQARDRNAKAVKTGKVALRRVAVEDLSFENATFDKALAIRSMQLWPDAVAGLQEIQRVLRPEGTLVLGFTRRSGQTERGLSRLLTDSGFTNMQVVKRYKAFFVLATKPAGVCAT